MNLIKEDLKELLDKNALLLSIIALIFTSIALLVEQNQSSTNMIDFFKIEGILMMFVMFGVELSKMTLVSDKISKKLEFLLANGVSKKRLIKKYWLSLYLTTFIVILPSVLLNLLKLNISWIVFINFILSSMTYILLIVLLILYIVNMNKINSLQIRLIGLSIAIMILSFLVYYYTHMIELYLVSKIFILLSIIIFLITNTSTERIVASYY